jgi:hypothetical protein
MRRNESRARIVIAALSSKMIIVMAAVPPAPVFGTHGTNPPIIAPSSNRVWRLLITRFSRTTFFAAFGLFRTFMQLFYQHICPRMRAYVERYVLARLYVWHKLRHRQIKIRTAHQIDPALRCKIHKPGPLIDSPWRKNVVHE